MKTPNRNIFISNPPDETCSLDSILEVLKKKLRNNPSSVIDLETEYEKIKSFLLSSSDSIKNEEIRSLYPSIEKSTEDVRVLLFSLLKDIIPQLSDKWGIIEYFLSTFDKNLVLESFDLMRILAEKNLFEIDMKIMIFFAQNYERYVSLLGEQITSNKISGILRGVYSEYGLSDRNPVINLYFSGNRCQKIFAAKILDGQGMPVSEKTAEKLLGKEASKVLEPYLIYTRASYEDLLNLIPLENKPAPIIYSLKQCETVCRQNLIREVIAKLGWESINYGISVKRFIGLSFKGSLPIFMNENDASLFEKSVKVKRTSEYFIFTAHGGLFFETTDSGDKYKTVALFRSYNLEHANLLKEILDIVPLTPEKVKKIINQLDSIVSDFITLFSRYTEECKILPDVYGKIRNKIINELEGDSTQSHLSAEITRLVQMFEDPHSLGEVHTLHGLKRYLHQKGLQLGFKLVDRSRSPNRGISLVLTSAGRVLTILQKINYADFEPESQERFSSITVPYPIKVVIDGFERHLLYGQESFPSVNIFCYGNEVHYFVWFRNHPVFIRIDYSPPLHGGMIDLQYFGVSNYEIADHPNIYLDSIKYFFQFLEFDVKLEGTHIQARYDKERAIDLGQLCERVEFLFCLAVYLMDLDWVIGSFNYKDDAKKKVIQAWTVFFSRWGILPLNKILSKDRLGIIQNVLTTPEGDLEQLWSGEGEYRDRYSIDIPDGFFDELFYSLDKLDLGVQKFTFYNFNQTGQFYLEKKIFSLLRETLADGGIKPVPEGYVRTSEELFQKFHEAYIFKEILISRDERLKSAIILAKITATLEQTIKFRTTGTLGNFDIQSAILPLRGYNLKLYVLRNKKGMIRLAFFIYGNSLFQKRNSRENKWQSNAEFSSFVLRSILRSNNYTTEGSESGYEEINEEIEKILDELRLKQIPVMQLHTPREKAVMGLRASPGRVTGRVLLGTEGRLPEDFNDHIFVALSVSPDDNTILFHSAGIVATSGGILSHAGLIATQFNKPALIIPGEWKQNPDGTLFLLFHSLDYQVDSKLIDGFTLAVYHNFKEQENQIRNGDLVVLDANESKLTVLGQERDAVTLFEDLKALGRTNEDIGRINDVRELLILRGRKLHIRHRIEKLLKKISEPVLIMYAVREILIGNFLEGSKCTADEKAFLLSLILHNENVAKLVENYLIHTATEIENKFSNAYSEAEKNIPKSKYPFEVVMLRLKVIQNCEIIKNVIAALARIFPEKKIKEVNDISYINEISLQKLQELRSELLNKIFELTCCMKRKEYLRHLFRQSGRIDMLLNTPADEQRIVTRLHLEFEEKDEAAFKELGEKFILTKSDGSLELAPMIGWKAANLAELEQLDSCGLIPSWFAITDKAFQRTLGVSISESYSLPGEIIIKGVSLREAIDRILVLNNLSNREKSLHIKKLWNSVTLQEDIKKGIFEAYTQIEDDYLKDTLVKKTEAGLFIAIRSSSCEEDAENAARAGEFETYLYIHGKYSLIDYLKRTWSGLWTERAIHNRAVFGYDRLSPKGGVIVQRIVNSRVSGVLQTINVAKAELKEIVINAGLGLGEGIVSGRVAADLIIVYKEGNLQKGPLHFNYITADKKEHIVYNQKAGFGTVLTSALYHQRFRPALEYVELCELVAIASRLEDAYGYPIDIEFGIEGNRLWILQVRPVATFLPAFRETIDRYPVSTKNKTETEEK